MTPMAPTRHNRPTRSATLPGVPLPMSARQCRIPLMADLAAPAAARSVVEDAIRTWRVPVNAEEAILLTSELVTNAVTHGTTTAGTFVVLTIACDAAGLRVDVHDGSGDLPVLNTGLLDDAPAEAETGRGLLLVTTLSAEWGFYRTPAGKAVYFTLEFRPNGSETVIDGFDLH
ncbi:MAG TPA: ATP-binding protein [Trebonia sp.]|jgi:anti-sigma regulatory factor (Ser/Thr protein kinase)|nr:ATP-binding protein [Trebonia sp.]